MAVTGLDHFAMPTADPEPLLAFYKRLGFPILFEDAWRQGKFPIFSIRIGSNHLINVHTPGFETDLRGPSAQPGCGDFCCVWEGTLDEVLDLLRDAGIEVVEGPVPRVGGRGGGTVRSESVYVRDPDGNLVEFMVYSG